MSAPFINEVINLVCQAYGCGVLQYEPMMLCGLTVTMDMYRQWNTVTVNYDGKTLKANVYDKDSVETQNATIKNLIQDVVRL